MEEHRNQHAYSVSDAKENLDELVGRAEAGESIDIVRGGKRVARIVPVLTTETRKMKTSDIIERLREHLASQNGPVVESGQVVRQMRDEYRF